jgi:succinyl-diaminopimelate desuccinylase
MEKAKIADQMNDYRESMVDAVVRLCSIASVKGQSTANAPFGAENARVLGEFLALGNELGFRAVNLDGYCGYLEWGDQGPIVAALGHLDVVPAVDGWSHDPFSPIVTADRIIARGTADDKGPVISALFAMKALRDQGFFPRGRIRLIVGLDEESGSECMRHYVQVAELPACGFTPDAEFPVIYAEKGIAHLNLIMDLATASAGTAAGATVAPKQSPQRSLDAAQAGQRANMVPARCDLIWQEIDGCRQTESFLGKAAHASMPWEGRNAIALAMAAAAQQTDHRFANFYQHFLGEDWTGTALGIAGSDTSGPLTVNPGVLAIDRDKACLTIDIRYPSSWDFDALLARLRLQIAPEGVNVEIVSHTNPLHREKDSELVQRLMAVYNLMTGSESEAIAIGGGTYARTMPNIVAFGPTFPGEPDVCHQVDESITVDKLLSSAAIYREALRELSR